MIKTFIVWGIIHIFNWLLVMLFISVGIGLSTEATDALISDPYGWLIFPVSFVVTFVMTGFEILVWNTRSLDEKNDMKDKVSLLFDMYPTSVVIVNFSEYGKVHVIMKDGTSINLPSDIFDGTNIGAINRDGVAIDYTSMHYMYSSNSSDIVIKRLLNLKAEPNTFRVWDTIPLKMTGESVSVPERKLNQTYSMEQQHPLKIDNKDFIKQWRRSFIKGGSGKK